MRPTRRMLLIGVYTLLLIGHASAQKSIPTTVCDVRDQPRSVDGKSVQFVADAVIEVENSHLQTGDCSIYFELADRGIHTKLIRSEISHVDQFEKLAFTTMGKSSDCPSCAKYRVSATFVGTVVVAPENGPGFGHTGRYRCKFVVTDVLNMSTREIRAPKFTARFLPPGNGLALQNASS